VSASKRDSRNLLCVQHGHGIEGNAEAVIQRIETKKRERP
jgi:hypothetical protein